MKFHERFGFAVGSEEARRRFVARAHNLVLGEFVRGLEYRFRVERSIVSALGEHYQSGPIDRYTNLDFLKTLEALEGLRAFFDSSPPMCERVDKLVQKLLNDSEVDLEVRWENG